MDLTARRLPTLRGSRAGEAIVYPTRRFTASASTLASIDALERLAELKGRDRDKALSVLVSSRAMLETLVAVIPRSAERLIEAVLAGPLTIALVARPQVAIRSQSGGATTPADGTRSRRAQSRRLRTSAITLRAANPVDGSSPSPLREIATASE